MGAASRGARPEDASGPAAGRLMQIGEAAERVGLSVRTVRHYEEAGLIVPSARTEGGFRLYTEPVAALRDQLAMAEGFAGTLRTKLDYHGRPTA